MNEKKEKTERYTINNIDSKEELKDLANKIKDLPLNKEIKISIKDQKFYKKINKILR